MSRRVELVLYIVLSLSRALALVAAAAVAVYLFNLHAIFNFYAKYFELTANDAHTQSGWLWQRERLAAGTHWRRTHVAACSFTIEIELQNLFASQSLQTLKMLEMESAAKCATFMPMSQTQTQMETHAEAEGETGAGAVAVAEAGAGAEAEARRNRTIWRRKCQVL